MSHNGHPYGDDPRPDADRVERRMLAMLALATSDSPEDVYLLAQDIPPDELQILAGRLALGAAHVMARDDPETLCTAARVHIIGRAVDTPEDNRR